MLALTIPPFFEATKMSSFQQPRKINLRSRVPGLKTRPCSHDRAHANIILPGAGSEDMILPETADLVQAALAEEGASLNSNTESDEPDPPEGLALMASTPDYGDIDFFRLESELKNVPDDLSIIIKCAGGLQRTQAQRQLDGLLWQRFGPLVGAVDWAAAHMKAKYQPAVKSLSRQIGRLRLKYAEALPELLKELARLNPEIPLPQIFVHAVRLLDKQLAEPLSILSLYTEAFGQYRDGTYRRELEAINYLLEQSFLLFRGGNLEEVYSQCTAAESLLESNIFKVGDVFLTLVSTEPLSTIPGGFGPVGIHLMQVPFEMLPVLGPESPLLLHEGGHNLMHDIEGREEQVLESINSSIDRAAAEGELELSQKTVGFGKQRLPLLEVLRKFYLDCMGEIDSDLAGVLSVGPSYLKSVLQSFPAMLPRQEIHTEDAPLLSTESYYYFSTDDQEAYELNFEPHPHEWIRCHIIASALEQLGFDTTRDRLLIDEMLRGPVPKYVTFSDMDGESDLVLKVPAADVLAAAPFVTSAIMFGRIEALGNRSAHDLVNFNAKRQKKVETIVKIMLAGDCDIPLEQGHFFPTYVAAAAPEALSALVERGIEPEAAVAQVNELFLCLLEQLRSRCIS